MESAQRVAFVLAQVACANARIAGMMAENQRSAALNETPPYGEDAFAALQYEFMIGHNAVIEYLRG